MSKELERIKAYVLEQTSDMGENSKVELLDALAWWASEEAGSLNFESPDAVTEWYKITEDPYGKNKVIKL